MSSTRHPRPPRVRVHNFAVSREGIAAGFNQTLERPFGDLDPAPLMSWAGATDSWPNRTDIPIIGDFLDPPTDDSPREPFDTNAVWIPTTTVATAATVYHAVSPGTPVVSVSGGWGTGRTQGSPISNGS